MTTLGAAPAIGPTERWEKMTQLSPATSQFLRNTHRLWWRLDNGQHLFLVLPLHITPADNDGGYYSIDAALKTKGMR
jgi:hypothetical protein